MNATYAKANIAAVKATRITIWGNGSEYERAKENFVVLYCDPGG